jgi:predicted transcriptional regulator
MRGGSKVLENKETYTLRELIENLPYSLREFGKKYDISEVTIARLRDGKPGMRSTINKLLMAFSEVYNKTFTMRNVSGIILRGEMQIGEHKEEGDSKPERPAA